MKELINKYLSGTADRSELSVLLLWLRKKNNRQTFDTYKLDWKNNLNTQNLPEGSENSWNEIQNKLLQKSYDGWQSSRKLNLFFRIAAVFFFLVSMGSAIYFISTSPSSEIFTTVVTGNGQISKVVLPDSSQVWLNSHSEISYSNLYSSKNRNIKLIGEAYFEVRRNEDMPLIVSSGELEVKVLGTKFDVNAYPELRNISVVLEEGKVQLLSSVSASFNYELKPGEKAMFNKITGKLRVRKTNVSRYTSWKDGMIHIYDQTLAELVKRLETRYNQKFIYDESVKDFPFTFTIKNESLAEVIRLMKKIAPIKAKQEEGVIVFELDEKRKRDVER